MREIGYEVLIKHPAITVAGVLPYARLPQYPAWSPESYPEMDDTRHGDLLSGPSVRDGM